MPEDHSPEEEGDAAAEAASAALRRATRSTKAAKKQTGRSGSSGSGSSGGRSSGGPADARDPQPLSTAMERLVVEQGWQDQSAVAVLMSEWAQIVGDDLAAHVVPVSYEDGELTLQAESTTWATQTRLLLPQLHRAVDERVGKGVVTAIRLRGPQAPTWGGGPRRVPGRGPRDTYG